MRGRVNNLAAVVMISCLFTGATVWALQETGVEKRSTEKRSTEKKSTKDEKIRMLLEISGAGDIGKQVADNMLEQFRQMPEMPEGFIDRIKAELQPQQFVERIVPIYSKYLSEQDIDEILTFYQSPAGKRLVSALPNILQESMEVGQRWGKDLAERVLESIKAEQKKP